MKKNRVFFIGVPCSEEELNKSFEKYYKNIAQVRPQQLFDFNILSGISNFDIVTALSIPPVESYPKVKKIFIGSRYFTIKKNFSLKMMPIINIPVIKSASIFFNVLFFLVRMAFIDRNEENKIIVLGHLSLAILVPAIFISKITNIPLVCIVPDLPDLVSEYTSNFKNRLLKLSSKITMVLSNKLDGYILLTEYMNERVNKLEKPFIICEGVLSLNIPVENFQRNVDKKYIMYAGTLHKKFGIKNLVDSFLTIDSQETELWIFGQGDFQNELKEIVKKNKNIRYLGTKSKSIIYEYEKNALFLINPRPSEEEFTKYSFPSKTIEYLSSGRPLLTTNLRGIPEEYKEYVYILEDNNEANFTKSLETVLNKDISELDQFGLKAKKFVEENKNIIIQGKSIHQFLNNIIGV